MNKGLRGITFPFGRINYNRFQGYILSLTGTPKVWSKINKKLSIPTPYILKFQDKKTIPFYGI
jgi:hypothetical protein